MAAAICGGMGALLGALVILLQAFQAFSGETLVAHVTTRRLSPVAFELTYLPAGGQGEAIERIRLEGDQWVVSGGILKWHPWLTVLGLQSYHKPMRLSGQFSDLKRQRAQAPMVYPLRPERDWLWERLYWASAHLPFIEAVYGSSAYAYVEPSTIQEIYVTVSGYLIKRANPS